MPIIIEHTPAENTPIVDMDAPLKQQLLAKQAEQLDKLKAQIRHLTQLKDQLEASLVETYGEGTTHSAEGWTVSVGNGRKTLDARRFQQAYPAARHPECYEVKPLPLGQLARKLGETNLTGCIQTGKPTVKVSHDDE